MYPREGVLQFAKPGICFILLLCLQLHVLSAFNGPFSFFARIYRYQSHDYAFSSVEKLMYAIGGDDYVRLLNQTLRENLKKAGFSETFLNEMIAPVMKVNFGQSTDLNAFVGKPESEGIRGNHS